MMEQAKKELHHRRSIRLAGYDYTSEGRGLCTPERSERCGYFVTCVTHGRACLFGEVVNGAMKLNDFGEIVKEEWFKTAIIRPNVELIEDEFVVMPNHIHGIIWINDELSNSRGTLQRAPTKRAPTNPTLPVERF